MIKALVTPVISKAAVRVIDEVSDRVLKTEKEVEGAARRLLRQWQEMEPTEKQRVVEIIVATGTAAIATIAALRRPKRALKSGAKIARSVKTLRKKKKA
jgi:hypothetical protein